MDRDYPARSMSSRRARSEKRPTRGVVLVRVLSGIALVGVGIGLAFLGATGAYAAGVRADATHTAGSIDVPSLILMLLGAVAALTGAVVLFREYERALTR